MQQAMQYLQNPWVIMVLNGLIAGWLAGVLLGGGGLIRNLLVGILGAILGGLLIQAGLIRLPIDFNAYIPVFGNQLVVSTIGAILVVLIARLVAR